MNFRLTATQVRVLGALIEKDLATPEYYPLSVNGLMLACNQKTNREPVMSLDEPEVLAALEALRQAGLAMRSADAGRVAKYGHNVRGKLALDAEELAVLCVLLLRGPQTAGEVRTRCERMRSFADVPVVEAVLERLMDGDVPLVTRLERLPGRKEHRYAPLLGANDVTAQAAPMNPAEIPPPVDRVAVLEEAHAALRAEVAALREELHALRAQFD